jgi:hypothetical protein
MTFETADDVLEHFGVKGMRWGVRNNRRSGSNRNSGSNRSGKQKTSKKKRAVQIAVVGGALVAGAIIAHRSGVSVSSLRGSSATARGSLESARVLARIGENVAPPRTFRMPSVPAPRVFAMPPVPAPRLGGRVSNPLRTSAPRLGSRVRGPEEARALRASIAQSIRAANKTLRDNDNRLNIPFAQRSYLTEWD